MWTFLSLIIDQLIASGPSGRRVVGIVRPSGRMLEEFSDKFKMGLNPDIAERLEAQPALDTLNDLFTPHASSVVIERTPFGTMTLAQPIHKGLHSTVFAVKEFPNFLIKYQAHCHDLDIDVHPLLRDAWYTNASSAIGLSPVVHFISPPSRLCSARAGKCGFSMSQDEWVDCRDDDGPLRYMIMDRLKGTSLHNFRMKAFAQTNGAMDFETGIKIGVQLIQLIQRLHEETRIVHGDIHSPNIVIQRGNGTEFDLKLIDFGLSFNVSNMTFPETPVRPRGYWFHHLYTSWQIEGYAWSPRDDVIKAIQTIAHLMHPYDYFDMEKTLVERGYRSIQVWKLERNWFVTSSLDPVSNLNIGGARKGWIYALLDRVLRLGREMKLNERPPYEEIIAIFNECLETLVPMEITTTEIPSPHSLLSNI